MLNFATGLEFEIESFVVNWKIKMTQHVCRIKRDNLRL